MVSTILSFLQQTVTVITRRCNQHTHVRGILFATETLSAKQVSICDGLLFLRILFWKYLSGLEINTIVSVTQACCIQYASQLILPVGR